MIKNYMFLGILFFIILSGVNAQPAKSNIILTGKISSCIEGKLYLYETEKFPANQKMIDSAIVNKNGTFSFKTKLLKPIFCFLKTARKFKICLFYIESGDSLTVNILYKNDELKQISFSGKYNLINQYLWEDIKIDNLFSTNYIKNLSDKKATRYLDSITIAKNELFYKYKKKTTAMSYVDYLNNRKNIKIANLYYYYLNFRDTVEFNYTHPDSSYYIFLNNINLNDTSNIYIEEYPEFLVNYVNDKFQKQLKLGKCSDNNKLVEKLEIADKTLSSLNRDIFITSTATNQNIYLNSSWKYIDFLEAAKPLIKADAMNPLIYDFFVKKCNYFKCLLPGNKLPVFELTDTLKQIHFLDEFKGKYVYIDFWYTACSACISSFSKLNDVIEKYKTKNIVFVDICTNCIEKNTSKWKSILINKQLQSFHFKCNLIDIAEKLLLSYFPRYILLDQEGKVINSFAPAADKIEKTISELKGL